MILRLLKLTTQILPLVGGLLLIVTPFLPWAYGSISQEPYSVWSALVRVPDNPIYWVWLALTGISGLIISALSTCAILVRGSRSQRFWLFNLGIATTSFFFLSVLVMLTVSLEPPYAATLGRGAIAAVLGPIIAIAGILIHQFILRRKKS